MAFRIIGSSLSKSVWLEGLGAPTAHRLLAWEQSQADALLGDVFGYHALQVGWPALDALRNNRIPHGWTACTEFEASHDGLVPEADCTQAQLWMDSRTWPWPADSLDLVVLPHTLEQSSDPHACLREVERVLIPEGQVFITGLNPLSLWGWRQRRWIRHQAQNAMPHTPAGQLVGYQRLRDWLRLLGFEVQISRFGGWTPAFESEKWVNRWSALDRVGPRWWPILGGVYLIMATKRVAGGRLLSSKPWRAVRSPAASTAPVARSDA